jgi:hypothetical protein
MPHSKKEHGVEFFHAFSCETRGKAYAREWLRDVFLPRATVRELRKMNYNCIEILFILNLVYKMIE